MALGDTFMAQLLQRSLFPFPPIALPQLEQDIRLAPMGVIFAPCSFWWHVTQRVIPFDISKASSGKFAQEEM